MLSPTVWGLRPRIVLASRLATLRNGEQGRSLPDAPTRDLLAVIAKHPAAVEKVLRRAGFYTKVKAQSPEYANQLANPDAALLVDRIGRQFWLIQSISRGF